MLCREDKEGRAEYNAKLHGATVTVPTSTAEAPLRPQRQGTRRTWCIYYLSIHKTAPN